MVVCQNYLKTMLLIEFKKCKKPLKFENELFEVYLYWHGGCLANDSCLTN